MQARSSLDEVQAQHQRHRVLRRFLESLVLVELLGAVVGSVDDQRLHTSVLIVYAHRAADGILQQRGSELDALGPMVDGQAGQDHHRNGFGHVASAGGRLV